MTIVLITIYRGCMYVGKAGAISRYCTCIGQAHGGAEKQGLARYQELDWVDSSAGAAPVLDTRAEPSAFAGGVQEGRERAR